MRVKEQAPLYPGAVENRDYYIVKEGDTIDSIAERFLGDGLPQLLRQLNGISGNYVKPGTILLLHPRGLEPETEPRINHKEKEKK